MADGTPGIHTISGTGKALWGPGDMYTFLVTGEQTGGSHFAMEGLVPPGGGPPPHTHDNEDETLYVLEGTCSVQIGEQRLVASAGDIVFLPRGTPHAFRNEGPDTLRLILTFLPAGIERYFELVFDPVEDRTAPPPPPSPELIERLVTAGPGYGITFHLPA
jgi:quercetin dioxygenase-like cupin family protein